ncbi:MAG: GNAT family N-acetyltransferase [Acidimicrobiia bacterium]|nr:GNAT family N-acetyltransferase [Acidimicrobiia bacterium]
MIEYRTNVDGITPDQLEGPFFVGWPNPPSPATHLRVLDGSAHVVVAVDESNQQVVGFINAITDGVFMAFIPLLEVVPEYQGRGIGSELVRRLLELLDGFYTVDAMTDPELQPFYRHLGLEAAHGVALRDYERQSGE